MVRKIVACLAGVVVSAALGCKSEPSKLDGVARTADSRSAGDHFNYQVIDGVPVVLWTAADGKHVTAMRVDARWACDISSGQLVCGPKEAATAACEICPCVESCPCREPQCTSGCNKNVQPLTGLHDAALPPR